MPSQATCRIASQDLETRIAAQKSVVADIEKRLWDGGFNEALLVPYQTAFRELEALISARGCDDRHGFVVVIAVADRPRQLRECLDSLLELCRAFGYGGQPQGRWQKVSVVIADDSNDDVSIAGHRELARRYSALGLETIWLGADEQIARTAALGASRQRLVRVLGARSDIDSPVAFGHKGQAVIRNIAALKLNEMAAQDGRLLFHAVDSDQEFKVKVATAAGDKDVCAVNFFYRLDEIFSTTDAQVLTGKVVGDPPVSPAVMAGNFLEDVVGFLQTGGDDADAPCRHHQVDGHREGEAAYHDMADLFGFRTAEAAYRYCCPLHGRHTQADCFAHFAARLNGFFYGEHPTRVSHFVHDGGDVRPARTVYVGNYVCRAAGLEYFIPFAALRLRMSGPTLGRILQAELGPRFVSANLPMLHKRTLQGTGQSEFRPGIAAHARTVDMSGEFERQFYGDVMLFSVERLARNGFPTRRPAADVVGPVMDEVRDEMLAKYNAKHQAIEDKLRRLVGVLHDPERWWNRSDSAGTAVGDFEAFATNIRHNFGPEAAGYLRINEAANWAQWRARLIEAVVRYPEDRQAWAEALAAAHPDP